MHVRVVHNTPDGRHADLGMMELDHMPPDGEPFALQNCAYRARGYFGPDCYGNYLLVLEGAPQVQTH